jgi:hypothetical protein
MTKTKLSCSPAASTIKSNVSNTLTETPARRNIRPSLKVDGRYGKAKTKAVTTDNPYPTEDAASSTIVKRTIRDNPNSPPLSFKNEHINERYSHNSKPCIFVEDSSCVAACMPSEEFTDRGLWNFLNDDDDEEGSTDEEQIDDSAQQHAILTNNDPTQLSMGYHVFPEDDEEESTYSDENVDEEETNKKEWKRAFLKLWEALVGWMTPQAYEVVEYYYYFKTSMHHENNTALLLQLQQQEELQPPPPNITVDTSDVGSSRCAGLMSILQLHLPKATQELGLNDNDDEDQRWDLQQQQQHVRRRIIQDRLTTLLLRFDYSAPMVNLDTPVLWRTLTIILVAIIANPRREKTPESAIAAGLSKEEYYYLTNSLSGQNQRENQIV